MEGTIILDDKKINVIVDFINENFDNDLNILKVIKNYRNLLIFLKNNSYSINLIEADVLFSKCPILADNIAILSENLDDIDESVVSLFEYCELNITMNKSKDIVKKRMVKEQHISKKIIILLTNIIIMLHNLMF